MRSLSICQVDYLRYGVPYLVHGLGAKLELRLVPDDKDEQVVRKPQAPYHARHPEPPGCRVVRGKTGRLETAHCVLISPVPEWGYLLDRSSRCRT